ncbi:uncharacterized protein Z518_03390 [Rhinocladiella mackenziei CBS 650.93]|uniref:Cation/H+ exchanger transmembrane domain-containing protein n=1 Tax=Rhinocladiella mackenziei CBS 650.93 TaxID=1442369 RepID=A0A0D2HDU7_9EURO|nr:uncharacterized protein Z518_03390 [Rhinocladiella mackenziei CBS 650.93]KIX08733.1 hypothetical protein Z518_03390 [Rhinocladiella mackenziei CBS 650.93]
MTDAIPYEEPSIVSILILSSFILILNILGSVLDHVFYCGLVGQVLVGMVWGTPGAKLLSRHVEEAVTQLGYLGLIAIVFEGGLSTSAKSVRSTLFLSICVGATGIMFPIALSFSLIGMANATNLQAFAAGSALCSTSLGTTLSLLKTTGLTTSRLGTVLTSAAMLDDVVGLIMVQVISNLGSGHESIQASTILRPIFVSIGFAIVLPLACTFLVNPILRHCSRIQGQFTSIVSESPLYFILSTTFVVALVTAASYAGTSTLFAAYIAGAVISWLDEIGVQNQTSRQKRPNRPTESARPSQPVESIAVGNRNSQSRDSVTSRLPTPPPEKNEAVHDVAHGPTSTLSPKASESRSIRMYNEYYAPAIEYILKPFFFASIGFSIPLTKMFRGAVVWRGFAYSILMAIGKLSCGIWLVRFAQSPSPPASTPTPTPTPTAARNPKENRKPKSPRKSLPRPKPLYPASILGCAMVARGEIGFIISALATSNGIFTNQVSSNSNTGNGNEEKSTSISSDIYLIATWAILLCTVIGPLVLGFLAKRVKKLQSERAQSRNAGTEDPLGIWGVT